MDDLGYPHDLGNAHMIGGNVEPNYRQPRLVDALNLNDTGRQSLRNECGTIRQFISLTNSNQLLLHLH